MALIGSAGVIVGALVGALVTGFFTLVGPLALETRKARHLVAQTRLDSIQGVRTTSIMWLDHLEATIMDLRRGRPVDLDAFRATSAAYLEGLSRNKFAYATFEDTTLLERLREANRRLEGEITAGHREVSEATYRALRAAFDERALFSQIITGQAQDILRRLERGE